VYALEVGTTGIAQLCGVFQSSPSSLAILLLLISESLLHLVPPPSFVGVLGGDTELGGGSMSLHSRWACHLCCGGGPGIEAKQNEVD